MALLFDRKYSLTVGQPDRIISGTIPTSIAAPNTITTGIVPQSLALLKNGVTQTNWQSGTDWLKSVKRDAVEITDLQIIADIKGGSNNSKSTTAATIKIYNMATSTRNIVERVNNYVILNAGYAQDEELKMVFSGQVTDVDTIREGQNLITTLQCSDAYSPENSVRISKKFERGQTYGDIISYLAQAYADNGVPTGDIVDRWGDNISTSSRPPARLIDSPQTGEVIVSKVDPQNYVQLPVIVKQPAFTNLVNGYSAVGYLHQVLERICDQIGYVSYITNGRLFVHPKGFTRMVEQYEFTTDQIKSIRKSSSQTTNSSIGKGIEGIKLKTFLDGRLDIDKRIKILDGDYAGSYKIITKTHQLDYELGAWDTTLSCKEDSV